MTPAPEERDKRFAELDRAIAEKPSDDELRRWPTVAEAATRLGVSERGAWRLIAVERLRTMKRPLPGSKPVTVVDPADVHRLRERRERAARPVVIPARQGADIVPLDSMIPAGDRAAVSMATALVAALRPAPIPPPRPTWLTLAEAAEASGLPKSWLRGFAEARGEIVGHAIEVIDLGAHAPGGRWRFRRETL